MASYTFDEQARVITVEAPDITITCQEIYNFLKKHESHASSMSKPTYVLAAGKTDLGAIGQTVITLTLTDVLVKFEDRPGPTYEICNVIAGNLVGVDEFSASQYPLTDSTFVFASISQATTGASIVEDTQTEAMLLMRKILDNALETDPVTGKMTLYDDDGVTPIREWNIYEDIAKTQPYRSQGTEVRDKPAELP